MKSYTLIGTALLAVLLHAAPALANKDAIQSGKVTYTKNAGGYTYLKVKEAGKDVWIAAMPMTVAVGDKVEYAGGDTMKDFKSKAMDQTFDSIRFVSRIHVVNKDMPKDDIHKGMAGMPMDDVHKGVKPEAGKVATAPKQGEISKPRGGKTVAELYSEKDKLNGKKVTARAKVMKVSKNILGKNWVTMSDGSGKAPDDKIVVATLETPAIGDVLTASGVLKTNVNLGAGYLYKVVIEDAKFSK
jgi:hypothetical protein